jgi:acyl-homoserine lactone acylase PvdQ
VRRRLPQHQLQLGHGRAAGQRGQVEDGPRARAVMTYGQSDDPSSPNLHDQATIYAGGSLRDVAWTEAEIAADVVDEVEVRSP